MNDANLGYDCRNNADNARFEPIINEIGEIGYLKKYHNLFYTKVSSSVNSNLLERQVEQDFQQQMANIRPDDPFKAARIASIKNKNKEERAVIDCLKQKEEKSKKRKLATEVYEKLTEANKNKKLKAMVDLNKNECNSIKSIAVKGNTTVEGTSRFINGKMLMFSKVSIKSFVYDLIDVFCFPNEEIKDHRRSIIECHIYLNLTDMDSCSIFFNFICKKECNIRETESGDWIFEILKRSKIIKRLGLSDEFGNNLESAKKR